jgi:hypothetical protein
MKKLGFVLLMAFAFGGTLFMTSCKKSTINVNAATGDGDVTGNGGSKTETFDWDNNLSRAEFNMDITAADGGTFQMIVEDAAGVIVLNETLTAGTAPDSKDGCSAVGAVGTWKVTLTLTDFNGDGSYSLSKGC